MQAAMPAATASKFLLLIGLSPFCLFAFLPALDAGLSLFIGRRQAEYQRFKKKPNLEKKAFKLQLTGLFMHLTPKGT